MNLSIPLIIFEKCQNSKRFMETVHTIWKGQPRTNYENCFTSNKMPKLHNKIVTYNQK